MMEFDIRELLDGYVEDSIEIQEKEAASVDKIKEDVMNRIEKPARKRARKWTRTALTAAVCAATLTATALAAELLRLDERRGGAFSPEEYTAEDGYETVSPAAEPPDGTVYTTVNAVGVMDSPEYKAAREWSDWCLASADKNELFPDGIENYTEEEIDAVTAAIQDDVYAAMGADTGEAREALDAIAAKYGLRVPESFRDITQKDLYDMTGEEHILPLDGNGQTGRYYEGGSLSFAGSAALESGKTVCYDLVRSVTGMFSNPVQFVLEEDIKEEWQYTTVGGTAVTLDLGANRSALMARLDSSFVYVHIRGGTENNDPTRDFTGAEPLTRADLEAFAESIDFTALDSIK